MVVRELITKLGFDVNMASFNNAEKGFERLKQKAESISKNKQLVSNFDDFAKKWDKVIAKGSFELDAPLKKVEKAEKQIQKTKDGVGELAVSLRNILIGVASLFSLRAISNIADSMQNLRSRISLLPQTVGDVGAAFDEVADRASAAGVSIDAYGALYTRIGNAAKKYLTTQEEVLGITDTISQVLLVSGASVREASSTMIQFSQALGAGTLQGEEFRSMAEAAPQYLDKLSEAMNIPREKLKELGSQGKLTSKEVIEATQKMAAYWQEKFNQMPMTTGRAITIVTNRFSKMIDKINRDTSFVSRFANFIVNSFDKIESGINKLVKAADGWNNVLREIGFLIITAFGAKALSVIAKFNAATFAMMARFVLIAGAIVLTAAALEDLYVYLNKGESAIGNIIKSSNLLQGIIDNIAALAATISGVFTQDWALVKEGLKGLFDVVINEIKIIGEHIYKTFFESIVNAVRDGFKFIGQALDAGKGFIKSWSNLDKIFSENESMKPGSLVGSVMGTGANISNQTNVTVTVPQGTTAEQAAYIEQSAQKAFGKMNDNKFARDLAVYSR